MVLKVRTDKTRHYLYYRKQKYYGPKSLKDKSQEKLYAWLLKQIGKKKKIKAKVKAKLREKKVVGKPEVKSGPDKNIAMEKGNLSNKQAEDAKATTSYQNAIRAQQSLPPLSYNQLMNVPTKDKEKTQKTADEEFTEIWDDYRKDVDKPGASETLFKKAVLLHKKYGHASDAQLEEVAEERRRSKAELDAEKARSKAELDKTKAEAKAEKEDLERLNAHTRAKVKHGQKEKALSKIQSEIEKKKDIFKKEYLEPLTGDIYQSKTLGSVIEMADEWNENNPKDKINYKMPAGSSKKTKTKEQIFKLLLNKDALDDIAEDAYLAEYGKRDDDLLQKHETSPEWDLDVSEQKPDTSSDSKRQASPKPFTGTIAQPPIEDTGEVVKFVHPSLRSERPTKVIHFGTPTKPPRPEELPSRLLDSPQASTYSESSSSSSSPTIGQKPHMVKALAHLLNKQAITPGELTSAMTHSQGARDLMKAHLATTGSGAEEGMSNIEIDKYMKKHPSFLGTIASDEIESKILPQLRPGMSQGSFIMNLDGSSQPGSHWVAVYFTPRAIEYYNPLADPPTENFRNEAKKIVQIVNPDGFMLFKKNNIQRQSNDTKTCGYHAMKFIIDRENGKSYSDATGFSDHKKDDHVNGEKAVDKFIHHMTGDGFEFIHGDGIIDTVKEVAGKVVKRISDVWKGVRQRASPSIRKFLETNGDAKITKVVVGRQPITPMVEKVASLLSLGKYDENKKKLSYDKMMHLFMICTLDNGKTIKLEKNHFPEISITSNAGPDSMSAGDPKCTMNEFLANAEKKAGGTKLWIYE